MNYLGNQKISRIHIIIILDERRPLLDIRFAQQIGPALFVSNTSSKVAPSVNQFHCNTLAKSCECRLVFICQMAPPLDCLEFHYGENQCKIEKKKRSSKIPRFLHLMIYPLRDQDQNKCSRDLNQAAFHPVGGLPTLRLPVGGRHSRDHGQTSIAGEPGTGNPGATGYRPGLDLVLFVGQQLQLDVGVGPGRLAPRQTLA